MRGTLLSRTWRYDPSLHAPARYRRACSYEAFVPTPLEGLSVAMDGELAGLLSDAERRIFELNREGGSALKPLARLLLRTESIASSKVEGMQANAKTLARSEVAQDTGRSVGSEVAEILANIDAMQFAIEEATTYPNFQPTQILDIHEILMARSSISHRAGRFRDSQGWIGGNDYNPCGADFVPPPAEQVQALVDDLCRFCSEDRLSPLAQAAIAHAQFETIHPFDDGNGRTGRALVQVMLRRRGIAPAFVPPISVVLSNEKDRYIKGLIGFREDDLSGWLEMFASAAARAADLAGRYLEAAQRLQEEWRQMLRESADVRADAAAWALIDVLPGYPVITVAVGVAALEANERSRARAAVQVAVGQLERAAVLVPLSQSKRNRAWEASGLLDLIEEMESQIT